MLHLRESLKHLPAMYRVCMHMLQAIYFARFRMQKTAQCMNNCFRALAINSLRLL